MSPELRDWRESAREFDFRGHHVAFWTAGDVRAAPPVVLIHGYPTSSWDWARVWDRLSAAHPLVACDMLGFGLSDLPGGYSMAVQADLHEALLAHLGIDGHHALVHDYGATVGQELLARRGERQGRAKGKGGGRGDLLSMYFLNGGIVPGAHRPRPIQRLGASRLGWIVGRMMNRKRFGRAFSAVFGPHTRPTEAELDDHWALISHNGGHRQTHRLLHYMAERVKHEGRWVGALRNAAVPIGILNGALDPVSGAHLLAAVREVVPDIPTTVLEDVGHYPQLEAPKRVAEAYLGWVAGVG